MAIGSYVNVGQSILEIARTEVLRYRASVPERYAAQIAIGQKVILNLADKTPREVQITRISPTLDSVSRSLMFEAEVPNTEDDLRSGSFAQADVILDENAQSVVIPSSALVRFAGVQKVWKVVDGQVREAVVEIGDEESGQVRIQSGLNAGDILLVNGNAGGAGKYVAEVSATAKNSGETNSTNENDPQSAEPAKLETAKPDVKKSEASNSPTPVSASASRAAHHRQLSEGRNPSVYWLAEICVKRPVLALMIISAMIVAGLASFPQLGVDRFPNIDLPTVYVRAVYPGAASEEVESEVTQLLEDSVATVAGIEELRSISSDGSSMLLITFNLDRNIDAAVQDIRDAVAAVVGRLPPNVDPPTVRKNDLDSSPILTLAVSGPRTSSELYYMADRYVKAMIESAPGVGEVTIAGAADGPSK